MIDLNVLKIVGAFIAGVAGIIGILGQTRTQDNKLTRSGKLLFGLAIVGVVLALGTQIWEWKKNVERDLEARQQAADWLHEIRRAVSRFQSFSFDWTCSFDSTDRIFGPYIQDLAKLAEDAANKPWPDFEKSDQGLRPFVFDASRKAIGYRIDGDSSAMPDEAKYSLLRHYILEAVPQVYVFKKSISPTNFVYWPPDFVDSMRKELRKPDLILTLTPGDVSVDFRLQTPRSKAPTITVLHSHMNASVAFASGEILSLEDLGGSQAIMLILRREFQGPWSTARNHWFKCRINDQTIALCSPYPFNSPYSADSFPPKQPALAADSWTVLHFQPLPLRRLTINLRISLLPARYFLIWERSKRRIKPKKDTAGLRRMGDSPGDESNSSLIKPPA